MAALFIGGYMKRIRKKLRVITTIIMAVAVAFAVTWLLADDEGRQELVEAFMHEEAADGVQERQIDWDALPPEVIAWVEVPGTSIDEPIVQATPEAPNAYLYEDVLGQGAYGTPYIDCECSIESPFVMVYGHHMSDGSDFADFAGYIDEAYANEHKQIIIYERIGETRNLEVMAVDVVNASREKLTIPKEEEFAERIAACDLILQNATDSDRLWAFATCSYQTLNSRTIVYCAEATSKVSSFVFTSCA